MHRLAGQGIDGGDQRRPAQHERHAQRIEGTHGVEVHTGGGHWIDEEGDAVWLRNPGERIGRGDGAGGRVALNEIVDGQGGQRGVEIDVEVAGEPHEELAIGRAAAFGKDEEDRAVETILGMWQGGRAAHPHHVRRGVARGARGACAAASRGWSRRSH